MTDKQLDALELASVAESADLAGYPTAKKANAYCLCLLEDCAQMIRRLHAENETLTLYKSLADEYGLSIFKDLKDLGDAGSDVQLLRMGYAAARLEIESLRKEHADELAVAYMCGASREKELAAQQPGAAGLIGALEDAQRAINSMKVEAETAAQGDEQMMLEACETISNEGLQADMAIRAALASHGQAPAQAAPAYKDSTPELHIGDSAFESWYSSYSPAHKSDKQRARDAYAAGMGDPRVTAAPAAVAGPIGYGPKVTVRRSCSDCKACNSESYAVQGDSGHYVYCEHPSLPESKYIGDTNWNTPHWCPVSAPTTQPALQQEPALYDPKALLEVFQRAQAGSSGTAGTLRGIAAVIASWESREPHTLIAAPQPSPAAQGDAPDTVRLDWLLWMLPGDALRRVVGELSDTSDAADFRAAIDAARAAQEGKSHDN